MKKLKDVQVGDEVIRMIAGLIRQELIVTKVTDTEIVCGAWTFSKQTGAEIDDDLDYSPVRTGSFLKLS